MNENIDAAQADAEIRNKKKRGSNFQPFEDVAICKAWLVASTDLSVGVNQTSLDFQKKVCFYP